MRETTNFAAVPEAGGQGPPTRLERRALVRSLLLGRALERVLAGVVPARASSDSGDAVLTAIAAASALRSQDRLILPHCLLTARVAVGDDPGAIAAGRLGRPVGRDEMRPGVGPHSAVAVAVGVALALRRRGGPGTAVAIVESRWAETDQCRGALMLAREERLPVVVVAIETTQERPPEPATVDWRDFEAVRSAVQAAVADDDADRGPALVFCSPVPRGARNGTLRTEPVDPVTEYERRLIINGLSRTDLDGVRREVAGDLAEALGAPARTGQVAS